MAFQKYEKDFGPVVRRKIEKIKADHRSGATRIALHVLELAGRIAAKPGFKTDNRRHQAILAFFDEIIRVHPQMVILHFLRREWRRIAVASQDRWRELPLSFKQAIDESQKKNAETFTSYINKRARLITISYSSSVAQALVAANHKQIQAVVSESRPMNEGRDLATFLCEHGIPTTLVVDAAMGLHIPGASAVILGADAISPEYFVNKIGSLALCLLAREHKVPVLVLADEFRLTGKNILPRTQVNHPPDEVVPEPKPYAVDNRYFDFVPLKLVKRVIFDGRIVTPRQLFKDYSRRGTSWPA